MKKSIARLFPEPIRKVTREEFDSLPQLSCKIRNYYDSERMSEGKFEPSDKDKAKIVRRELEELSRQQMHYNREFAKKWAE